MKLKAIILHIVLVTFSICSFGQNQSTETNSIDLIPHWSKNDVHAASFKTTTIDTIKGKPIIYASTFNANFKVLEKSNTEYLVEWIYTNSKVANNDPTVENSIISKLQDIKIQIKLSNYGKFIELVNVDEGYENAIEWLQANHSDQTRFRTCDIKTN